MRNARKLAVVSAAAALFITGCSADSPPDTNTSSPIGAISAVYADAEWPITECGTYTGDGCSATDQRVDLEKPTFANPLEIDNPLFPVEATSSVVQLGEKDGEPFRSESVRLPGSQIISWDGQEIEVALVQYVAWAGDQVEEIAVDRYAQADDGSVWYFGEDVFDYADGAVVVTEGTWLAGRDSPPSMIMPANPAVGDVSRPENTIGIVFEEVEVVEIGATVDGPFGPVEGAIVTRELHLDGSYSDKTFAPGFGEFITQNDTEIEAVAYALPGNAQTGGTPVAVQKMITASWGTLELVRLEEWPAASLSVDRISSQWDITRDTAPVRVADRLDSSLADLSAAVEAQDVEAASYAVVQVAQSAIDVSALTMPAPIVEAERFHLHTQQLRVAAAAGDAGWVGGETVVLEWSADRFTELLGEAARHEIEARLRDLRVAVDTGNLATAADHAARLGARMRTLAAAG